MLSIEIKIPQLGEGLQEARLIRFLKQPGQTVAQDEPIYEMETDKAVMEIESPAAGVLQGWSAKEDDVLPIGAVIGTISTEMAASAPSSSQAPAPATEPETDNSSQGVVEIRIPQLGEGLQEARLIRFLKQPGETVKQDEPIYEMETDKAVMEIESPSAGVLESWLAKEDDVLPIGEVIGRIRLGRPSRDVEKFAAEQAKAAVKLPSPDAPQVGTVSAPPLAGGVGGGGISVNETPPSPTLLAEAEGGPLRNAVAPPRTRAYARGKGVTDEEVVQLAQKTGGKLLPAAIDSYLSTKAKGPQSPTLGAAGHAAFEDLPLPARQKTLIYRLNRSAQAVIPATMEMPVEWSGIEKVRAELKHRTGDSAAAATQFLLFAWCVAQTARDHPRFRAALLNDTTLRQYAHLHLGIAVARPDDELLMARIPDAGALAFEEFVIAAQDAIHRARNGEDQTSDVMQLSLTNLASAGVRIGIPIVVAPSMATLFIGTPYDEPYPLPGGGIGFRRIANMVLTFDHRLANGVGAAKFLADVRDRVVALDQEFTFPA
jgi:pyruvate/2-oxoglutarate dehydrogenase complex dihydrolipoamide acyltransferase (E2) component